MTIIQLMGCKIRELLNLSKKCTMAYLLTSHSQITNRFLLSLFTILHNNSKLELNLIISHNMSRKSKIDWRLEAHRLSGENISTLQCWSPNSSLALNIKMFKTSMKKLSITPFKTPLQFTLSLSQPMFSLQFTLSSNNNTPLPLQTMFTPHQLLTILLLLRIQISIKSRCTVSTTRRLPTPKPKLQTSKLTKSGNVWKESLI